VRQTLFAIGVGILVVLLIIAGCATVRVTDPPRTATEQYLISQAAEEAIDQLAINTLRDRLVYVDFLYLTSATEPSIQALSERTWSEARRDDAMFLVGDLRARLLMNGVRLVNERDKAQIILEVRSGALGIDRRDTLVGIPSLIISSGSGGTLNNVPFATPEVAIVKTQKQQGYANVAFVAYWNDTGEVIASSGPFTGQTNREDFWFLGTGPKTVGNIPPAQQK
jgi:hypothetical protein